MRVFANCGYVSDDAPANTFASVRRAFDSGYDVKCDVRRFFGHPVLAADPIDRDEYEGAQLCLTPEDFAQVPATRFPPIEVVMDLLARNPTRMMLMWLHEDGLAVDISIVAGAFGVLDQIVVTGNSISDAVWNKDNVKTLQQARRRSRYERALGPGAYYLSESFYPRLDGPEKYELLTRGAIKTSRTTCPSGCFVMAPDIHYPKAMTHWNMGIIKHTVRKAKPLGVVTNHPDFWQEPFRE